MPDSKEPAARQRQRLVDVAARRFRERGVDGVAVADLMKEAGLAQDGLHEHFASKDALAAAACGTAFEESLAALEALLAHDSSSASLWRWLRGYVSAAHRDDGIGGCPGAALAVDAWRQGDELQSVYSDGIAAYLGVLVAELGHDAGRKKPDARATRVRALRLLSEIIGAVVLARATAGAAPALSEEILAATRESLS